MSSVLLMLIGLALFVLGYLVYSKYLARRVYALNESFTTPAHEMHDGVDYVPTNKYILWGHHFTSVGGAAPIVGPAIAVIWGWLPAFLWVTLGTVFFAGMHDLGTLWASQRNKGRSIGALSARYIGSRGANLFLVVIFLLLLMVIAAFAVVIKDLLISTPTAVIPTWGAIGVALLVGLAVYRLRWPLLPVTIVGVVVLYGLIVLGSQVPVVLPETVLGMSPAMFWIVTLFVYGAIASLLPVWVLLQPRDYINGVQLFVGLILLFGSVLLAALFSAVKPDIVAPAINANVPEGTPSIFPLLFVTVACGAISGFHGMVSSGTSSKQLDTEPDARFVGYFGAVGEGLLSLGTILAVIG
ncbi:MAG TPA: carbon starvation CstA family protein, partial [Ruania sp.]|nr:carbon starvation CstA family protein [Ruania sp.]